MAPKRKTKKPLASTVPEQQIVVHKLYGGETDVKDTADSKTDAESTGNSKKKRNRGSGSSRKKDVKDKAAEDRRKPLAEKKVRRRPYERPYPLPSDSDPDSDAYKPSGWDD